MSGTKDRPESPPETAAGSEASNASEASEVSESKPDFERNLGVIEAITIVTRSCPNGGVIRAAEQALAAIKEGGPEALKIQAYFVLTAIKGWRGDRAHQVHRSLGRYLESVQTETNESDRGN